MKKRILAITILITMMLTISETSLTALAEEIEEAIPAISAFSQNVIETLAIADESNENVNTYSDYTPEEYFEFSNGVITGYIGEDSIIIIPPKIGETDVTSIGNSAFKDCSSLTSITIPNSVTSIGNNAFYNCTGLEKINWNAKSVTDFSSDNYVFSRAGQSGDGIEVVFGDNVEHIPAYAFCPYSSSNYAAPNITSVTIGNAVTSIGKYAFYDCTGLEKINWNAKSVTDFSSDNYVFIHAGQSGDGIEVVFGNNVEHIPAYVFCTRRPNALVLTDFPNITSVTIGRCVTSISSHAFHWCTSLTSVTIPDSVTSIESYAFSDCDSLTSVTIPDSVTIIGEGAFSDCDSLTSVTIPDSVTIIGEDAFEWCNSLTSVTIGRRVTSIGCSAFYRCKRLEKINWNAKNVTDFYSCNSSRNYVFSYAGQSGDGIEVVFGDNVEHIPEYAFCPYEYDSSTYTPNITSVMIGNSVISIGYSAFRDCSSLTSVTIGDGVTSIGSSAFSGCTGLEKIYWNASNVGDFSSTPFSGIGTSTNGTEVIFGNNVERIPSYVFSGCTGLTSVTIPNSISTVGERAFYNCGADISVSDNTLSVGPYAFVNCNLNANNLYLTSVGSSAFNGCDSLTSVTIGNSVTSIGDFAFYYCDSLTSVTIPDSVTSIGSNAFNNCTGLTDVYYGGTEDEWKNISIGSSNTPLTSANIHYLYNTSGGGIVNETRYGDINFKVTGFEDADDLSIKSEPVVNATITINGVTKSTDANGIVGFSKDEITLGGNLVQVSVSAEGYLDYKNEIILVAYGTNNISMTKKNPDKIYIANLSATGANGKLYNVMQQNTFTVDKTDTTKYNFKVNMDWNGFNAGKVYLQGAKSGKSFEFVNGEVTVSPGVEFDVGENIRVVAYTVDESKSTSKENLLNVITLPEDFSLVIPEASTGHLDCIPFLEGKSFTVGFDKGIEKYAGNVEVKDGKLVLDFSDTDNFTQTNKYKIFGENKLSIGPYGKLEIPLYNFQNNDFYGDGEWSGTFGLKTKLTTKAQTSDDVYALIPIVAYNYNTVVMVGTIPVPVTATAAVEGGVKGELEVGGTLEKANFSGTVEPAVGIDLFGGLGQDYDSVEIKAGVYGELVGRLPVSMDFLNDNISFNPSLEGSLGARASVKVYIVDLEGEFEAGKFKWSKDGFTASWLGNEVVLLSLDNDADNADWQLAGREYLENGGGFIGGNSIALFDLEVTNKDEQIIYNNIFHNAEAVLQNINDKDYLIYTIDDIERQEQNGLKLVYSEKLSDGTWSEPTPIDDDGTLDSIISTDDKFVAWEDMKSEISASATSMTEIFSLTEISAAYFDGEKWNSTQLTDDNVYDFSPVIKSNGNTAVAAWLSNTDSDFTSKSGITNIHYATFDGTNWSEVTTIEDVGAVTRVTAAYDGDTPYVFYKKDGIISSVSVTNDTVTALSYSGVGQYAVDNFNSNVVLAYFDSDGNLKVASDAINSSTSSTVTTEANVNSIPVIATNDTNMYVGWIDRQDGYDTLCGVRYENGAWSDKITFVGEEANVSNPSLIANDDGTFSASYFKTGKVEVSESGEYTTGEVNLFVNNISPSYNLAIDSETLSYDDEIYARGGGAAMTFDVMNVGEKTVSGFDIEIYENDELKKTISKTTELKAGATTNVYASYVPNESGKVQELQIKVIPKGVDDFDARDNVAILTLGTIDATVSNAYFTEEGSLNCVNAIIKNNGSANVDSITVSVHKGSQDGEVIYQTEIGDVLAYEELLVKTEISENDLADTSLFYVTVLAQNDVNTYNDYSIAVKKNDGDLLYGQELAVSVTYDVDTKTATINSNANSSGEVIAAAYQGGRLISIKSKPIDILVGNTPAVFDDLVTENADTVKIMVWNNLSTLKPLCDACIVELD